MCSVASGMLHRSNQVGGWSGQHYTYRLPQVEHVGVAIDICRFGRMVLDDGFLWAPEQAFDVLHFLPCWDAVLLMGTRRDMLPPCAITDDYAKVTACSIGNDEHAIIAIAGLG